eukprot:scpid65268/ scgid11384/ Putative malate dehydrogenase 1B
METCVRFLLVGIAERVEFQQVEAFMTRLESLPDFSKRVEAVPADQWSDWLTEKIGKERWQHHKYEGDLLVVREVALRGGDCLFVGGAREFYMYAKRYYEAVPTCTVEHAQFLVEEHVENAKRIAQLKQELADSKPTPIVVCVTDPTSDIAQGVLANLLSDGMFPPGKHFALNLLVDKLDGMEAVTQDVEDCALANLQSINVTTNLGEAFGNADVVIVCEQPSAPCTTQDGEVFTLKDSLSEHRELLVHFAEAMCKVGKERLRVVVTGPHGNIGTSSIHQVFRSRQHAGSDRRVTSQASLCERYARMLIAKAVGTRAVNITNVVAWGKLNRPCLISASSLTRVHRHGGAIYGGPDGYTRPLHEVLHNKSFLARDLQQKVREHALTDGGVNAVGKAVADVVQPYFWWPSAPPVVFKNQFTTVGLADVSCLNLDIPEGITFACPARFDMAIGAWVAVPDLPISPDEHAAISKGVIKLSEYFSKCGLGGSETSDPSKSDENTES